jgi:hypothetical protein
MIAPIVWWLITVKLDFRIVTSGQTMASSQDVRCPGPSLRADADYIVAQLPLLPGRLSFPTGTPSIPELLFLFAADYKPAVKISSVKLNDPLP